MKWAARIEKQNIRALVSLYRVKDLLEVIGLVVFSRIMDLWAYGRVRVLGCVLDELIDLID